MPAQSVDVVVIGMGPGWEDAAARLARAGTQRALSEAVQVFERRQPGNDPEWISYFDDAELSAEFGHCFRDIGRASDAVTYAGQASSGASARSDFFVTMVLASGHLGSTGSPSAVEEACRVAQVALDLGAQLKSARCAEYLRQFHRQLAPFAKDGACEGAHRIRGGTCAVAGGEAQLEGFPISRAGSHFQCVHALG